MSSPTTPQSVADDEHLLLGMDPEDNPDMQDEILSSQPHLLDERDDMEHPVMIPSKKPARSSTPTEVTHTGLAAAKPETHSSSTQHRSRRSGTQQASPPALTHLPGPDSPRNTPSSPHLSSARQKLANLTLALSPEPSFERATRHGNIVPAPLLTTDQQIEPVQLSHVAKKSTFERVTVSGKYGDLAQRSGYQAQVRSVPQTPAIKQSSKFEEDAYNQHTVQKQRADRHRRLRKHRSQEHEHKSRRDGRGERLLQKISDLSLNINYNRQEHEVPMYRPLAKQDDGQLNRESSRPTHEILERGLSNHHDRQEDQISRAHPHLHSHEDARPSRKIEGDAQTGCRHGIHHEEVASYHQSRPSTHRQSSSPVMEDESELGQGQTSLSEWEDVPESRDQMFGDHKNARTHRQEIKYQGWVAIEAAAKIGFTAANMIHEDWWLNPKTQKIRKRVKKYSRQVNAKNAKALLARTTLSDISRVARHTYKAVRATHAVQGLVKTAANLPAHVSNLLADSTTSGSDSGPIDEGWDECSLTGWEEVYHKSVIPGHKSRNAETTTDGHHNDDFFDRAPGESDSFISE